MRKLLRWMQLKITKKILKQLIQEELDMTLNEQAYDASEQFKEDIKNAIKSSALAGGSGDRMLRNARVMVAIKELHDAVLDAAWK